MDVAKNFAKTTVSDGNYDAADTSIDLISGDGDRLPAVPFNAVWWNATDYPDPADDPGREIVRVTARTDDTLTITRAQEGTGAQDHNVEGKTYKLMAGLTALIVNMQLAGDVHGNGPGMLFDQDTPQAILRHSMARYVALNNTLMEAQSVLVLMGDVNGEGNSGYLIIDDANSLAVLNSLNLATTQIESASGPVGTIVGKLAIRDGAGDIVGYWPIYDSIT